MLLLRDGYQVNRKQEQRLKRRKPKIARMPVVVRGSYPNHRRTVDFQFDETAYERPVKILNVTDELSRDPTSHERG